MDDYIRLTIVPKRLVFQDQVTYTYKVSFSMNKKVAAHYSYERLHHLTL